MILCVFFSTHVSCDNYKELFKYSFRVKIFFNFVTPENSRLDRTVEQKKII